MVGGGLSPVSENLHSADDLANSEESENLSGNNSGGSDLGGVGVTDGTDWVWADDGLWVLDEGGEEVLESGHWSVNELDSARLSCIPVWRICHLRWAHLLSTGNELGKLKANARIVDGWWDLA